MKYMISNIMNFRDNGCVRTLRPLCGYALTRVGSSQEIWTHVLSVVLAGPHNVTVQTLS